MLIYLGIYLLSVARILVSTFLLQESYNIRLEDSGHYKIYEFVDENDYEMIKENEIKQFHIDDRDDKLYGLKKLARKEYHRNLETRAPRKEWFRGTRPTVPVVTDATVALITTYHSQKKLHIITKRNVSHPPDEDFSEYDYLLNEYYEETVEESHSNHSFHVANDTKTGVVSSVDQIVKFDTKTRNCTEEEIKHIGFRAIYCIFKDYKNNNQSSKVLAKRLYRIMKIWFLVYLVIATPLWCTRGWCCCCLFCKFFKPKDTIDKAKRYLVRNPPGLLTSATGDETKYEPTEYEQKSYEEFEHMIRII